MNVSLRLLSAIPSFGPAVSRALLSQCIDDDGIFDRQNLARRCSRPSRLRCLREFEALTPRSGATLTANARLPAKQTSNVRTSIMSSHLPPAPPANRSNKG
jgi:hypothetical protein